VLVSDRCGAHVDLVRTGVNGFTFDPRKGEELLALMRRAARGELDLVAMGEASRRIVSEYTPERAAGVVIDAIDFVMGRGGDATRPGR